MPDTNTPTNDQVTKIISLDNLETYTTYVERKGIDITYAEYQQLTPAEKQGKTFYITDYLDSVIDASKVDYDNTNSGLESDDVQDAIDELKDLIDQGGGGGTDTTYTLSVGTGSDVDKIVLTPSAGTPDIITVPYATDAGTVNGKTVSENVPSGAVFTDTTDAASLTYSNTTSGLSATKVQNAIDELSSEKKDEYTTITYAQWQQLTPTQKAEKDYYISDYPTSPVAAGNISYSNTSSGMTADDVQGAVDELASEKKDEYTTITYAQWQALTPAQKSVKDYYISDYPSSAITAGNVNYSNTTSGISANNVQGAVDELKSDLTNVSIGTFAAETGVTIVSSSFKKSVNTVTFIAVLQKVMVLNENNLMGILPIGFRPSNTIVTMAYNDTKDCPIKMQLSPSSGGLYIAATSDTADAAAQNIYVYVTYVVN